MRRSEEGNTYHFLGMYISMISPLSFCIVTEDLIKKIKLENLLWIIHVIKKKGWSVILLVSVCLNKQVNCFFFVPRAGAASQEQQGV